MSILNKVVNNVRIQNRCHTLNEWDELPAEESRVMEKEIAIVMSNDNSRLLGIVVGEGQVYELYNRKEKVLFPGIGAGYTLPNASSTTLAVDLTMGENCKKAYVLFTEPDSHSTKTEITMSDWVVAKGTEFTASGVASYDYANPATHIYVVWIDSNDKYHTYYEYTPTYPEKPTEPPTGSGDDSGIF